MNAAIQLCRMIPASQGGFTAPVAQSEAQNANVASCGGVSSFQQLFFKSLLQTPQAETAVLNSEAGSEAEEDGIRGLFQEMSGLKLSQEMILSESLSGSLGGDMGTESGTDTVEATADTMEATEGMSAKDLAEMGTVGLTGMPAACLEEVSTEGFANAQDRDLTKVPGRDRAEVPGWDQGEVPTKAENAVSVDAAKTGILGSSGTPERREQAVENAGNLKMTAAERVAEGKDGRAGSASVPKGSEAGRAAAESMQTMVKPESMPMYGAVTKPEGEARLQEKTERKAPSEVGETPALTTANVTNGESPKPLSMASEKMEPYSQIGREIQLKLEQKGPMEFKMQLVPKDLGQIDVRLKINEGKLIIDIAAASSKTQALLIGQADKLVMSMGLQNVEVETVQVNLQTDQHSGERQQGHLQQQQEHLEQQAKSRQSAPGSPSRPYSGDAGSHPESALGGGIQKNNFVRMDYTI